MPADLQNFVPVRDCDGCTACCKILSITELGKPMGKWCPNCSIGIRCEIYDSRPAECRDFYCGYLQHPDFDDRWRPDRCKFVIVAELEGTRLAIHMDPGFPSAWRREPFYSKIKEWSAAAAQQMHQVVVCIGKRAIVVLPDRDVDLGLVHDDDRIITWERRTATGKALDAVKMKADDPRIAGMVPGKPIVIKGGG
jgi:hypothetical protein